MAVRTITTKLAVDGETEYKRAMSSVNSELKTVRTEMALSEETFKGQANSVEALTAKDKLLRKEIAQQQEKIKSLAQAVVDSSAVYGSADKKTNDWRQSLNRAQTELIKMQRELQDTEGYLDEASKSADGFATTIDGFGNLTKQGGGMSGLLGQLDDLKGALAGGIVVGGIQKVVGAMMDLEESTREYRQIMGTLEASSAEAGYTAEETAAAYEHLYGVLGDTQSTATTVANLQATGASQEELIILTDQLTGAWAKYGDSIPIDGLSEAVNETIRCSEVTGVFADVLNWGSMEGETFGVTLKANTKANEEYNKAVQDATTAEDFFNIALQNCKTDSERLQLVMDTMSKQGLTDLGKAWRDTNEDIIKVNESQNKLDEQWARMGKMVAPAVSALKSGLGKTLEGLLDSFTNLISKTREWGRNAPTIREMLNGGKTDGSHAGGLSYVPFDGYIAELHQGEQVLTAAEASAYRALSGSLKSPQGLLTARDMQEIMAASVNALSANSGGGSQPMAINLVAQNGDKLARWILPDLRAAMKADPEVMDD